MGNPYQAQAAQAWVGLAPQALVHAPEIEPLYRAFFSGLEEAPSAIARLKDKSPPPPDATAAMVAAFKSLETVLGEMYDLVEHLPKHEQRDVEPVARALNQALLAAQRDAAHAIGVTLPGDAQLPVI